MSNNGVRYKRSDYLTWLSASTHGWKGSNFSGCNARNAALLQDGHGVKKGTRCKILGGTFTSPYTSMATLRKQDARRRLSGKKPLLPLTYHFMDIDHIIPLGAVSFQGGGKWSSAKRAAYANDPLVLVTTDSTSNRSKGDQTAATWLPELNRCGYAERMVQVKAKYKLTVTPAEKRILAREINRCAR